MNECNSVKIGNQFWMDNNLSTNKYRNGDAIVIIKSEKEWLAAITNSTPACYVSEVLSQGKIIQSYYYNWFAVIDPRGLAPDGWRIPTDNDAVELITYLENNFSDAQKAIRGIDLSHSSWADADGGSRFKALPMGYLGTDGGFTLLSYGSIAVWWTSDEVNPNEAKPFFAGDAQELASIFYSFYKKSNFLSVRCLKNDR